MIGKCVVQPWLEVDWILGQFSNQRKRAVEKYVNFVREGVGLPSKWEHIQNQIFLGSEKFINNKQKQINEKKTLSDLPRLQTRALPKSLEYYENTYHDQKKEIFNAYISGGYTLKQIGDYFGKHSTVSKIVKSGE